MTDLFNAGKELQDLAYNIEKQLGKLEQEISDANVIKLEFRSELRLYQEKSLDALQALAVSQYKLFKAKNNYRKLQFWQSRKYGDKLYFKSKIRALKKLMKSSLEKTEPYILPFKNRLKLR